MLRAFVRGLGLQKAGAITVLYKKVKLDCGYRMDIVVAESLVLELKTVEKLLPIHQAQLLTYLKLSGKRLGFIINFNVRIIKEGIKRVIR